MEIKDILAPDCTKCAVHLTSKKRVLEYIANIAAEHIDNISHDTVLSSLLCRERMGSTGIGSGIAIPHGRIKGLNTPYAVVVTSDSGIEFDAIDNQSVDIFFAIFVPEDKAEGHLHTLAKIAARLNDKEVVRKIRKANSDSTLYEILV